MAVVNILSSSTSPDTLIMHLLRTLHFNSTFYTINLIAQHNIVGTENTVADAISRNFPQVLFSQVPEPATNPDSRTTLGHLGDTSTRLAVGHLANIAIMASLAIASHQARERPIPQHNQGT